MIADPFKAALAFTLTWEGGLVEHPDDPGGLTNYGISQRAYPLEDIRNLSRARVEQIYSEDYWDKIEGDKLPPEVAFVLFDYAVHAGTKRAIRDLQTIVHAVSDGIMGAKTHHALSFFLVPYVVEQLLLARGRLMVRLGQREKYTPFLAGWINRLVANAARWNIQ